MEIFQRFMHKRQFSFFKCQKQKSKLCFSEDPYIFLQKYVNDGIFYLFLPFLYFTFYLSVSLDTVALEGANEVEADLRAGARLIALINIYTQIRVKNPAFFEISTRRQN
jgi:hypothetical protein